jgi:xanthine dehydrogenase YagT iron-sulfur-binding subunit
VRRGKGRRRSSRRDFMIASGAGVVGAAFAAPIAHVHPDLIGQANATSAPLPPTHTVHLTINGNSTRLTVELGTTLLSALRDHGLVGTKAGCEVGACGACTVLVDGRRVKACLTLVVMADGAEIRTIEGVSDGEKLHPLQRAFVAHDGLQCGYCTPGQIMSAVGYLAEGHAQASDPSVIREWMSGNLCRCGAYPNIVTAIAAVACLERANDGEGRRPGC